MKRFLLVIFAVFVLAGAAFIFSSGDMLQGRFGPIVATRCVSGTTPVDYHTAEFDILVDDDVNPHADFDDLHVAITAADSFTRIAVCPGQYLENLELLDKELIIRGVSADPTDVVIDGGLLDPVFIITDSILYIENVTITNGMNLIGGGGGIDMNSSTLNVRNVEFNENEGGYGGAVNGAGGPSSSNVLHVERSFFEGNKAVVGGGAIGGNFMDVYVAESYFENNNAVAGGAIDIVGPAQIQDNSFIGNSAREGGSIAALDHDLLVQRNLFQSNYSDRRGGALYIYNLETHPYVRARVLNNTFAYNSSKTDGGAVYSSVRSELVHNTFYSNMANNEGSAVHSHGTIFGNLFVNNYNPLNLTTSVCEECHSDGYNYFTIGSNFPLFTRTDLIDMGGPLFLPIDWYGGVTDSMAFQDRTSEAVDAIPSSDCFLELDQRAYDRPDPIGLACDIGSFEMQTP